MQHLLTCILFMISTFTFGQEKMPKEIKGSKLIQYLLVSDTSGRMGVFDSSASEIYSNGNVLLYDLTYHYSSSLNEIELVSEERHHYFIHSKDSLYGYDYDGYKQPFVRRIRVDSVLSPTRSANMDIREVFARNESKLIASKHNSDSGTAHETYILHAKGDESQQSTFFLDYSKQPFTLETNPLKDPGKLKDMNLCKVRIVSECYPCRFDINYSIENIPVIKEKILLIFDEYIAKRSGSMSFYSVTTGLSR